MALPTVLTMEIFVVSILVVGLGEPVVKRVGLAEPVVKRVGLAEPVVMTVGMGEPVVTRIGLGGPEVTARVMELLPVATVAVDSAFAPPGQYLGPDIFSSIQVL